MVQPVLLRGVRNHSILGARTIFVKRKFPMLAAIFLSLLFCLLLQLTNMTKTEAQFANMKNTEENANNAEENPTPRPITALSASDKAIEIPTGGFVAKTKAHRCKGFRHSGAFSRSQWREDKIILRKYFDHICGGTYLEMGGFDGETYSNSYLFHYGLDWNGVLVEASPTNFAKMIKNRPNEIATVNAGVCAEERDLHWVNVKEEKNSGAINGFLEFASESFKKKWWPDEVIQNATIIRCRTITNILHETVGDHFHFDIFSLDVEGAELEALQSINFDLVTFGIVLVEANILNAAKNIKDANEILTKNGYKFVQNLRGSDWFVNENFSSIYKDIKN